MALNVVFDRDGIPNQVAEQLDHIIAVFQTAFNRQTESTTASISAVAAQAGGYGEYLVPTGGMVPYGGSVAPSGWLLCNGTSYSTTTYPDLFAVIGYAYGGAGGTFKVPDSRQRFPLGKAASGTGSVMGSTGGAIDHTHSTPAHTHTVTGSTANESSHTHSYSGTTSVWSPSPTVAAGGITAVTGD